MTDRDANTARTNISAGLNRQEAARRLCRRYLERMHQLSAAWRGEPSDRSLHQFRIGIRQSRVLLRVMRADAYAHGGRTLRARLTLAADHLGAVRDMDVILALIRKNDRRRSRRGKAKIDALLEAAVHQRDVRLRRANRYLLGPSWERIAKASTSFLRRWTRNAESRDRQTIKEFLDQEFDTHCRLIRRRTGIARASDPETLHSFRIMLRRLRYLGDLFERLESSEQRLLLRKVRKCEQLLGGIHDIDMAWAFFNTHPDLLPGSLVGQLLLVREEKLAKFRKKWAKCRRRL